MIGFVDWWVYGLLFLGLAAGVWWLARVARFWLARVFFLPLGRPWLTSFALTAVPVLVVSMAAAMLVVGPLASQRAAQAREDEGRARLASAQRALAAGDLERSRRELAAARESDPEVAGAAELERRIGEEQDRREAEAQRRDSDELAARARRGLAAEQLAGARAALARGNFASARDMAEESNDTHATRAARRIAADARAAA